MKSLSLVMITKNEENNLKRCLSSVINIVNEIIIVDTGSTDNTKKVALEYGAKVYDYIWNDNFSDARNYALSKSSGDWNLILDADEYITNINIDKINQFMDSNPNSIGQIKRIDFFYDNNEIRKSNSYISRLAPRNVYFIGSIHEQLDSSFPRVQVDIEAEHDGYLSDNKFNRNISLILNELEINPTNTYLLYQAAKSYYVNKMYNKASNYFKEFYGKVNFAKDAFAKDGLVLYLYNLIKTNEFEEGLKVIDDNFNIMCDHCDFYFACGVFFTEIVAYNSEKYLCYFQNIELCYLNALQLGDNISSDSVEGTGSFLAAFNLGTFYELTGNVSKSTEYYTLSSSYNYKPALNKLI